MKFKQSYHDEMDRLSPTDEQLERIRNVVCARLDHEADTNTEPAPNRRKKPLQLKLAAISGGACVCTCAAVLIIFMGGSVRNSSMTPMSNRTENDCNYAIGAANNINHDLDGALGIEGTIGESGQYSLPSTFIPGSISETNENSSEGMAFVGAGSLTAAPSSSNTLYLMFSKDKSSCNVTMNGKKYVYRETEFDFTTDLSDENYNLFIDESAHPLRSADSNLDIKLFVQFDENALYVFTESRTLYKYYTLN